MASRIPAFQTTMPKKKAKRRTTKPKVSVEQQLIDAMVKEFGPVDELCLQEIFPVHPAVHVKIHVIRPWGDHDYITLFTTGMSARPLNIPKGMQEKGEDFRYAELTMHLPANWKLPADAKSAAKWNWPIQWLRRLAYYPHQQGTCLHRRYTVFDHGKPLAPGIRQTGWFLTADEHFEGIKLGDRRIVHFHHATAILPSELKVQDKFALSLALVLRDGLVTNPKRKTVIRGDSIL